MWHGISFLIYSLGLAHENGNAMKTVIVSLELENRVNGIGKQWQCGKVYVVCMKKCI